ncbi:MAG: SDR family NAD(P)-dependent oxidoreductase [Acidimicrobiales bacterium]
MGRAQARLGGDVTDGGGQGRLGFQRDLAGPQITGAAQGLGAQIARRLAAEGARVSLADVDLAGAQGVAAELGPHGITANVISPA